MQKDLYQEAPWFGSGRGRRADFGINRCNITWALNVRGSMKMCIGRIEVSLSTNWVPNVKTNSS